MKRVATIQDFSCAGRCSLTVALPILSAAGIECCAVPTAVLSTHTGGFGNIAVRDLSDSLLPIAERWSDIGMTFDVIYTGYLSGEEQVDTVLRFIDMFRTPDTKVVVDPVMGDNGSLYRGFADDYPSHMARLCSAADVIVPNLTEAALLTGLPYNAAPNRDEAAALLKALKALGAKSAVLTGIHFEEGTLGACCEDENGTFGYLYEHLVPDSYHGTGDIFASVLTAGLALGYPLQEACRIACRFTTACIAETAKHPEHDKRFGVLFELLLGDLSRWVREAGKEQ